jgi:rhodanese-related sulfurtransferase
MFGDNSKEALGLTLNYNKPPDVSYDFMVSAVKASRRRMSLLPVRHDKLGFVLPLEITPTEVKRRSDTAEEFTLIDCREPAEHDICQIGHATLIPMRDISQQFDRLEEAAMPLIVFCHHGVRSLTVVNWLREQGLTECMSMSGGIDAWSREVDPTVPRY